MRGQGARVTQAAEDEVTSGSFLLGSWDQDHAPLLPSQSAALRCLAFEKQRPECKCYLCCPAAM